jgi:hypothetical protein
VDFCIEHPGAGFEGNAYLPEEFRIFIKPGFKAVKEQPQLCCILSVHHSSPFLKKIRFAYILDTEANFLVR